MAEEAKKELFGGKRLKLGIWGLGRGSSFIESARALGVDIVAACDTSPAMRTHFKEICPEAEVVGNEDTFFKMDFDAVLIATFFPDHAKHTLKALKAGKHVLCE
ncbi:MAG: Gfo/Idh/MocA family oxidoreductase, partial [Victivallales bacterium]|nr:Gfo/Idh/MocA family oxidoreductase [Victivallales bacterium]